MGGSPNAAEREALLAKLAAEASPSVPLLSAANYHPRCGPSAWDDEARVCVLLFVPMSDAWSQTAKRALYTMRAVARSHAMPRGIQFAWVDATRQKPFASFVTGMWTAQRERVDYGSPEVEEPEMAALHGREAGSGATSGLRALRVAKLPVELSSLSEEQLVVWLEALREGATRGSRSGGWKAVTGSAPPLRGEFPPSLRARVYAWLWSWGCVSGHLWPTS